MFLKAYTGLSDRKLYEHLNGSIQHQLFCGIFLGPEKIADVKIISRIRTKLVKKLNIRITQDILAKAWKPYMENPNIVLEDATCYEFYMRYPTNVKLLWESVDWTYGQMKLICRYLKQRDLYFANGHKRRKSQKEKTITTRSLLHLLNKLIEQQDKIVSISKSYVRPIIRGKEVKKVEFGAKVNMIQVDGINFIEHLSFDAFNEGPWLIESVRYSRTLFGKIIHISADDISANNANRKWCTGQQITTNIKRKGWAGKYENHRQIIAAELRKERATRMEGSFGTKKQQYSLDKIKARTELNEILWIFFGVHMANAVRITKRLAQEKPSQSAA